jgi:hypothetical protein
MTTDPSDSSYMPSLIAISAGDSFARLKEIKTINIGSSDSLVTLLEDVLEVSWLSASACVRVYGRSHYALFVKKI